jgi:hypothetical protein
MTSAKTQKHASVAALGQNVTQGACRVQISRAQLVILWCALHKSQPIPRALPPSTGLTHRKLHSLDSECPVFVYIACTGKVESCLGCLP